MLWTDAAPSLDIQVTPQKRDNKLGLEKSLEDSQKRMQKIYKRYDEWIRKLWYIYTMEYYAAIKKNSFESILMRWMKLEPIIRSEVSQKDKDHYNILTHIYGI